MRVAFSAAMRDGEIGLMASPTNSAADHALHAALAADSAARELGGPAAATTAMGRLAPESRVPPDLKPYTLDAVYRGSGATTILRRALLGTGAPS